MNCPSSQSSSSNLGISSNWDLCYFGIVPWIVQHPDVMDVLQDSELIQTEIEAYQNPVEVQSTLQNWQ